MNKNLADKTRLTGTMKYASNDHKIQHLGSAVY